MSFTPWLVDSFEHGRTAAAGALGVWDQIGGAPTIDTTQHRTGTRSLKIAAAGAAMRATYLPPASTRFATDSFYILFTSAFPGANCQVGAFTDANGAGQIRYNASTQKLVCSINNVGNTDVGPVLALDTWYLVDATFDSRTGTASMKVSVNGSATITVNRSQTAADITAISLGTVAAETVTAYFDDWALSITADDTFLGPHQVENLIPTADGTHNIAASGDYDSFTTTAFSNATTTGNTFIGHRPLQAANTANQVIRNDAGASSPTTRYMEFLFENMAAAATAPILAVRSYAVWVESSTTGASLGEARLCLAAGTEVLTTGSLSVIDSTEDPGTTVTLTKRMTIAPAGGWDGTKVNGLLARVGFSDFTPNVNFIDFMIDVLVQGSVAATPAVVTGVSAVPTPAVVAHAVATPAKVSAIAAVATPTVTTVTNATATPSKVSAVAAVATPTVTAPAVATPSVVTGVSALPAPTVTASAIASPTTVAAETEIPGSIVGTDSFDRANSAVSLGTADSGQVWSPLVGTWGIDTNQGYQPSSTASSVAALELGVASYDVSIDITRGAGVAGLSFAIVDGANYLVAFANSNTSVLLAKFVAGSPTTLDSVTVPTMAAQSTTWRVKFDATTGVVKIYTAGVLRITYTLTGSELAAYGAATKVGPNQNSQTANRWDNLSARALFPTVVATTGGTDATATPAVVEALAALPAPVVAAHANATSTTVTGVAALPAPTILRTATATPSVVTSVAAVATPTVTAAASATPNVVTGIAALPAPSILMTASATPTVVAAVAALPAPAAKGNATASASTVAAVTAVPTPTAVTVTLANPSVVAAVAALPAPSLAITAAATPAKVSAITAVATPTVAAHANATPSVVADVAAVPTPSPTMTTAAIPSKVSAIAALPAPSMLITGNATPAKVSAVAAVATPTVTMSAVATPSVIADIAAVPTPTVLTGTVATPSVVGGVGALPAPSVTGSALASASVVAAIAAVATPNVLARANALPSRVAAVAAVATPAVQASANATPSVADAQAALPAPSVLQTAAATPATVGADASLPTPAVHGDAVAGPGVVAGTSGVPVPGIDLSVDLFVPVARIAATAAVPTPGWYSDSLPIPITILGTAAFPFPHPIGDANATPVVVPTITLVPTPRVVRYAPEWPQHSSPDWPGADSTDDWPEPPDAAGEWEGAASTEWPSDSTSEWETIGG